MTLLQHTPFLPSAETSRPPVKTATRARDIDTLRGLACLALVSFHVVGDTAQAGLELPMDHWLHRMNATLVDMRMPLFSFLSGYVFLVALPRGADDGLSDWARDTMLAKARRLLLPMITVGTLFWLVRAGMGTPQQSLWTIYVMPFAHFWYLQATLLIMAGFVALVWLTGGQARRAAGLMLVAGLLIWLAGPRLGVNLFAVNDALRLSGFFAAGYLAAQGWPVLTAAMPRFWQKTLGVLVLLAALAVGIALAQGLWTPARTGRLTVMVLVGMGSCLALLLLRPRLAWLAWLGPYSYTIYLFHIFFTAGSREVLIRLRPDLVPGAVWLIALAAGLLGPVVVHMILLRHPVSAWALLGLRWRRPEGLPGPAVQSA